MPNCICQIAIQKLKIVKLKRVARCLQSVWRAHSREKFNLAFEVNFIQSLGYNRVSFLKKSLHSFFFAQHLVQISVDVWHFLLRRKLFRFVPIFCPPLQFIFSVFQRPISEIALKWHVHIRDHVGSSSYFFKAFIFHEAIQTNFLFYCCTVAHCIRTSRHVYFEALT